MKWPDYLALIRHDTSEYNLLRDKKRGDPLYKEFLAAFKANPESPTTRALAQLVADKYSLGVSDADTPLADKEGQRAFATGKGLEEMFLEEGPPDIIFVSPYHRTLETLRHIKRGWPALNHVKTYHEERIREQEHGLSLLYNDWRVFHALHPEQRRLRELLGPYWYQYPQGESVPMVRERNRSWMTTLTRDFAEKRVLAVTHHLNILAIRANLERWEPIQFIRIDEHDKPANCSLTLYRGMPDEGEDGHFKLELYNKRLH
jgi:broad specificity phosphatase PhoE